MTAEKLPSGEMLLAEFHYLGQTAFQANEDRARAASFYLVTFGSFIAALVTTQFVLPPEQVTLLDWGFAGLFALLAFLGVSTIVKLARLRQAWFTSVRAMNQVKEYYAAHCDGLHKAFAFTNASLPRGFQWKSLGGLMMLEVAFVGALTAALACFFVLMVLAAANWFWPVTLTALVFLLLEIRLYLFLLK
ncbi:MAG: hypothetical protein CO094_01965 [Anaerolineae bacterium CG_4_9_14_3_um_filter_57_17]|nr:hypothetical protein [bacterium]NCT21468.1 hypothetical protein [bacterium]OIO86581.1 MAG: hypothetical protein AUK01_02710 [Anaerolineae bacterium CG2_30_57_67]PJB68202.1 MAG: hypothetical protein CO094_01965 [Anaerolineae bacterium CG_4_9_14_3_um_filter_57_17]